VPRDPRAEVNLTASDADVGSASPIDDGVFRLTIVGSFGGHGEDGANPSNVRQRRAWRVDRDDVDRALAGIAPELRITLDPSQPPIAIRFTSIDDFHPDQLLKRVPLFQQLRALRDQTETPKYVPPPPPAKTSAAKTDSLALGLSAGSLLDRIVDGSSADEPEQIRGVAPQDELSEFIERSVRPHTVREATREQRDVAAKVDDVITATMRVILHHPDFQALESLWRGVELVVRRVDTSESVQVVLVDMSRAELAADLESATDGKSSAVFRVITQGGTGAPGRSSIVAGAYSFEPRDISLLSRLAAIGRASRAPWIVAAAPAFAGATSFRGDADPDEWRTALPPEWDALRRSPDAPFLSLALPRFMLREPYGKRTDPCDFPFEELPAGAPEHESYLWGNPALLCGLVIADAVADGGEPATHATVEGLPMHVATVDGEPTATPCVEAVITHGAVVHMVDRGLTPLASPRDGDSVILSRIQSVATPPRALPISTHAAG
jgi:type VI secretion system ImpC/EvpB family protein/type VI secretion system ImpB/VipA family protein